MEYASAFYGYLIQTDETDSDKAYEIHKRISQELSYTDLTIRRMTNTENQTYQFVLCPPNNSTNSEKVSYHRMNYSRAESIAIETFSTEALDEFEEATGFNIERKPRVFILF